MTLVYEGKVQTSFPPGYFDFRDVQWAEGSNKKSSVKAKYLEAFIPADRIADFIDGESVRGDTEFWVERTNHIASKGQAVRGTAPTTCFPCCNCHDAHKVWHSVSKSVPYAGPSHTCSAGDHLPLLLWS